MSPWNGQGKASSAVAPALTLLLLGAQASLPLHPPLHLPLGDPGVHGQPDAGVMPCGHAGGGGTQQNAEQRGGACHCAPELHPRGVAGAGRAGHSEQAGVRREKGWGVLEAGLELAQST